MTFQRSLFISIFIHLLVFGSAIAFAQYARGALRGHRDVMMVSLVGPGSGSQGRAAQGHREAKSDSRPDVIPGTASPSIQPEPPAHRQSAMEEASLPMIQENNGTGTGDAGDVGARQGQMGAGAPGSDSGAQFGLIPAEQWAVIESQIERSKNYPRMARERGIQGMVHVRFKVRPSGDVEKVEIVKSSGYAILDAASVKTVYRAAPMPYVNGWVEVPMAYVLK
jgi:TonB family protein